MDTLAKSDFFFFVTTIAVIVVTLLVVVLCVYVIRIASDLKYIVRRAKDEADEIVDDIKSARESIKSKTELFATMISSLSFLRKAKKAKSKKEL